MSDQRIARETGTEVTHPEECGDACIEHHTYGPDCAALNPDWDPTIGLRDRYAALFRSPPGEARLGDEPPGIIADAVLAARDVELTNSRRMWREQHAALIQLYRNTQERAEKAEAQLADRNRVLDNLLAEADRIDATTYKTSEGSIAMFGMAAGIREAVRTFRSRSEEHPSASYIDRTVMVADAFEIPPHLIATSRPFEHCGDQLPHLDGNNFTECVLRPGHHGSHAGHGEARWTKQTSAGYCPHCGSGDAGPTADEYEQARRRAVRIQTLLDEQRDKARKEAAASRASEQILQQQIDDQAREIDRLRSDCGKATMTLVQVVESMANPPAEQFINGEPTEYAQGWAAAMARIDAALESSKEQS